MSTFLTRMVDKGLLSPTRHGRANSYVPVLTGQGYRRMEARSLIDGMYNGSVPDFLATFYSGKEVEPDEIEALKSWFDGVSKDV
jgi:predicted transcriptional regulator